MACAEQTRHSSCVRLEWMSWTFLRPATYAQGRVEGQIDDRCNLLENMTVAPEASVAEVLDILERNWCRTGKIPAIAEMVELAAVSGPGVRSCLGSIAVSETATLSWSFSDRVDARLRVQTRP